MIVVTQWFNDHALSPFGWPMALASAAENLVHLEARREQEGLSAVTIGDLLRTTLRLRPDRILVGEVRGGEAFDLPQALNTGHAGRLSTIHANSAVQDISRFTTCVLQSGIEIPYRAIRSNIADALHLVVQVERRQGRRAISEVLRIERFDPSKDQFESQTLYST
ncbi:MAG: Flp pilus assembly complex ATPase component TadA [Bryobacterales bacterium]|nr:Flp pilus assembly complex ATPase component TadA [Bryobacterales bacterium]